MEKTTTGSSSEACTSPKPSELGSLRIAPAVRDSLLHPDAAPLQEQPKDETVEAALARVENLLGQGRYDSALREIDNLDVGNSPLAEPYRFLREQKLSRTHIGIADRYFLGGDTGSAKRYYQLALEGGTVDGPVREIAGIAAKAFDTLLKSRTDQVNLLLGCIGKGSFDQWCGVKRGLLNGSLLDLAEIQQRVVSDSPSSAPGSVFRVGLTSAAASAPAPGGGTAAADARIPASLAMPLISTVLVAKARLFAIGQGLNLAGQASGTLPLFRYEYLRNKTKETITHIRQIESRMLPIQFELDDFAEIVDAIRRPLGEQQAELEAVNQRIKGLVVQLAGLAQAKQAVDTVVIALEPIQNQCDCDWWCWTLLIVGDLALVSAVVLSFVATMGTSSIALGILYAVGAGVITDLLLWANYSVLTCDTVGEISSNLKAAQIGLQKAIAENSAELTHALTARDILIADINALENELTAVYQSNAARVLDAKTLDLIQAQYNSIRHSLLSRATAIAAQAQDVFNFERDMEVTLILDSYLDSDRKEYSAAESLLRDLDGLDYIDVTGRTQKSMQLSQTVSLRKHYPINFMSLKLTGGTRFTTALKNFDRWFPGTYLQRIKEIRVEVVVAGELVPVRGYLSNDGVSVVRFLDTSNSRPIDDVNVFAEPDADIANLCYKRLQRRRHVDTMAFPEFASHLYEERMAALQKQERNFFENIGLESTWIIQFLPDQPLELSNITDVLIHFQYEALFDDNLKAVQEKKRYAGRKEATALPIGKLLREEGKAADFSGTVYFSVPADRFEAPGIEKKIVNVGFMVKPKHGAHLEGAAALDISYDGATPIHVVTNAVGVLATATDLPAGSGLADLEAMAHGKSIDKTWTISITALPGGLSADGIEEIFLLLNYEYATA